MELVGQRAADDVRDSSDVDDIGERCRVEGIAGVVVAVVVVVVDEVAIESVDGRFGDDEDDALRVVGHRIVADVIAVQNVGALHVWVVVVVLVHYYWLVNE